MGVDGRAWTEVAQVIGGSVVVVAALTIASVTLVSRVREGDCRLRWEPRQTQYKGWACVVLIDGQWIPEKNVVIRIEGK